MVALLLSPEARRALSHERVRIRSRGSRPAASRSIDSDNDARLRNSIIANNGAQNCVRGTLGFVYEGKNISDDDTCVTGVFVMLIADLLLGTLADNGGPTKTLALDRNSPVVAVESNRPATSTRNARAPCYAERRRLPDSISAIQVAIDWPIASG